MSITAILFVATLLYWAGVMVYSWATTYPMFRDVPEAGFDEIHKTYEKGLPLAVYLPFALQGLAVAAACVARPPEVPLAALWASAAALVGGIVTTAFCAAPMHIALIERGKDSQLIRRMLACNAARTAFAVVGMAAAVGALMHVRVA